MLKLPCLIASIVFLSCFFVTGDIGMFIAAVVIGIASYLFPSDIQ
jgi:hypothetical protein